MMMGLYIFGLVVWSLIGAMAICVLAGCGFDYLYQASSCEFFNPIYCHKHTRVNWFGAFMVTFGLALLSPLRAAGFWFYKLCTVGRK
jgi:hypothetical protein